MSHTELSQQIDDAIGAHGAWKMRLRSAISSGYSDITPSKAACDDQCKLGQWLYGPSLASEIRSGAPYQVIRRLHADFHRNAGTVLDMALSGNKASARDALEGPFGETSEKLTRALVKWKREIA